MEPEKNKKDLRCQKLLGQNIQYQVQCCKCTQKIYLGFAENYDYDPNFQYAKIYVERRNRNRFCQNTISLIYSLIYLLTEMEMPESL